jgi:hypothetical protein
MASLSKRRRKRSGSQMAVMLCALGSNLQPRFATTLVEAGIDKKLSSHAQAGVSISQISLRGLDKDK